MFGGTDPFGAGLGAQLWGQSGSVHKYILGVQSFLWDDKASA